MRDYEVKCSDCGGSGKVDQWNDKKGEYEEVSCPTCGGSGTTTVTES